jgi:dTMP kinase
LKNKKRKDGIKMKFGIFIAFEGGDGCGKSTVSKWLAKELAKKKISVIWTREPGGINCPVSEKIRELLKNPENNICNEAEALLFAASRAQHVKKLILPNLEKGINVISDRFVFSSYIYQGIGRKLGLSRIKAINDFACQKLKADIVFLLDLDEQKAKQRTFDKKKDRIELENKEFHQKIRKGFLKLAEKDKTIIAINSEMPFEKVCQNILNKTLQIIEKRKEKIHE